MKPVNYNLLVIALEDITNACGTIACSEICEVKDIWIDRLNCTICCKVKSIKTGLYMQTTFDKFELCRKYKINESNTCDGMRLICINTEKRTWALQNMKNGDLITHGSLDMCMGYAKGYWKGVETK